MTEPNDFDVKVRAGCVITAATGREFLVESYEDVLTAWENAEPRDILKFTSFVSLPHLDKRPLQRFAVMAAAVYAVEEWGTEIADLLEADREVHRRNVEAQPMGLGGGGFILDLGFGRRSEGEGGGDGK